MLNFKKIKGNFVHKTAVITYQTLPENLLLSSRPQLKMTTPNLSVTATPRLCRHRAVRHVAITVRPSVRPSVTSP